MPGGYGTDESTPWGAAGTSYVSPGQSSSSYQPGGGSTNQGGSNAVAAAINEQNRKQSNEYLNDPDNFSNPQEQYAATLAAYNKKHGVAGGGVGLGSSGAMYYTDVPDVYYSTYVPGTQGHSPTGYQKITGPGLLSVNGVPVSGEINRSIYNPYAGGGGGGGGGGGYGYGYGYGSGPGYSSGIGGGRHPRSFYKGLAYQDFSGKEVQKMLSMNQKVDAANVLSGLSQGAQAFAMDPKARGIMSVLTA